MTRFPAFPRSTRAVLSVACSAALFWFGNDLHPWWPLMWFAPLPTLLFAAGSASWKQAALAAFAGLFLGSLAMWPYFRVMGAPQGWVAVYTLVSTVFAGAVLLFRARLRGGAPWGALLLFPAAMVSCEYLLSFTPGGSAGSLANTQLDFLPFLQLASVTGPYGLTFGLLGFPAALAVAWYRWRVAPGQAARVLEVAAGVLALVLAYGAVRLSHPVGASTFKVGLVAFDTGNDTWVAPDGEATIRLCRRYAAAAQTLAAQGAQIVVLPEKIGTDTGAPSSPVDAVFQTVADQTHVTLIVGLIHVAPGFQANQACVYEAGRPVQRYDKQHLLPAFEANSMRPGSSLTLLTQAGTTTGIAICKDLDHPDPARKYGRAGAGLLLVPAWDFGVDRWWHGHIAAMRGVENGFSVVRAAKEGSLYASDDCGRILAEARSDAAPFATLLVDVPTAHHATLYSRWGDWFAWAALVIFAFQTAKLFRKTGSTA